MDDTKDILYEIQSKLNAPKNKFNQYGGYKYRSCEDILEALKPMLKEYKASIVLTDEIALIGDRYYIKATAILKSGDIVIEKVHAYAREPQQKKGFDDAQITGGTSSYARKYALNGLFAIDDDDSKDPDNNHDQQKESKPREQKPQNQQKARYYTDEEFLKMLPDWVLLIQSGKYTAQAIIAIIKNKGVDLNPAQVQKLISIKRNEK